MSLLEACQWFESSWISTSIRQSKWSFAAVEAVHLIALAVFGGALLISGLRLWGLLLRPLVGTDSLRDLSGVLLGSFAAMLVSGFLLFADGPLRYYGNGAFRLKLLLIAVATVVSSLTTALAKHGAAPSLTVKLLSFLSCTCFLAAAVSGRLIGVL